MSRKGETPPDPRDALIGSLDTGQTGCITARATDGARYRVYVMLGEILAAQGGQDDTQLLARLGAGDLVDAGQLDALRARVGAGGPLVESLFEVMPEQALLELLFERFRENLLGYLGCDGVEGFQAMDAVFTDNIQVGHDSRALVGELTSALSRVATLKRQPDLVLAPGAAPPASERERQLLARTGDRVRLRELLEGSAYEPVRTLELVQDMLDRGTLISVAPQRKRGAEPVPPPDPSVSAPQPRKETAKTSRAKALPVEEVEPVRPAPLPPVPVDESYTPDDPTVEEPRRGYDPGDDEDLAAFQDYDTARGGGAFLTDRALLDRVDLDVAPPEPAGPKTEEIPAAVSELIEMEDAEGKEAAKTAVSLNFSGPKLHDEEIQRKLAVTNDVLATIAEAIEVVEGRGAGQARLQLLVEGTSVPLAPLFKGVELSGDGRLPGAQVIKNLRKRPAGEHRRLLNRGLSDLIERALSAAYETLDEPALEAMLERIAGYQQRLGI